MERRGPMCELPTLSTFRDSYPRNPPVSYLNVSEDEQNLCHLDLRPYLNPAPYTVYEVSLSTASEAAVWTLSGEAARSSAATIVGLGAGVPADSEGSAASLSSP